MIESATSYPLSWPVGRPRTQWRNSSRFKVSSLAQVRDELLNELKLMRASRIVLSTNLKTRMDGLPLAGQSQPRDPGVAVYFLYKQRQVCFACDRWQKIEDNMQAIRHTIAALRGIARWGTGDMVDAAFSGFEALPMPKSWRAVLGLNGQSSLADAEDAYRSLAMLHHPDRGGDANQMAEVNAAIERAREELAKETTCQDRN